MAAITWQRELQNKRIQYLNKSLLNGGAHLPFEELRMNVLRDVPGALGFKPAVIKKTAYAVSQGKAVKTIDEAESVALPMSSNMTKWAKSRLAGAKPKTPMPGFPTPLKERPVETAVGADGSENPLLKAWWDREIRPRLDAQGITGISWQVGSAPEVELVTKVKL